MKSQKVLSAIILLFTLVLFLFATPAVDFTVFGKRINWDGLNLATITGDRYSGELQFSDGLDVRGGNRYTLNTEIPPQYDLREQQEQFAKELTDGFNTRLRHYGFSEYSLKWWIDDTMVIVELEVAQISEYIDQLVALLAARGEIKFWSTDPDYAPVAPSGLEQPQLPPSDLEQPPKDGVETEIPELEGKGLIGNVSAQDGEVIDPVDVTVGEEAPADQNDPLIGMRIVDLSVDDLNSVRAEFGSFTNGYGIRLHFNREMETFLQGMVLAESGNTTTLTIDGEALAFRGFQSNTDPNYLEDYTKLYMNTYFSKSFDLNDALVTIIKTDKLEVPLQIVEVNEVSAGLGEDFESNFKLALSLALVLLSILLIGRYRWMGLFIVTNMTVFIIWSLFLLKFFRTQLTLSLIVGSVLSIIFFLLINVDFITRLKKHRKQPLKKLKEEVKVINKNYRNLHIMSLAIAFILTIVSIEKVNQISGGFGIGIVVSLFISYSLFRTLLPLAYTKQLKYETNKKS